MHGKILVTGATGHVGRPVVAGLLDAGAHVRALTRNPAAAELPCGVEVVRGDLTDPDTLEAALDRVDAVFLLWPTVDGSSLAALETIARHASRVVYLSSAGVRDGIEKQADPINQSHADLEHLIGRSGPEWTFLRPTGFATNTLGWAEQIRAEGVVRWPYGEARRSLIHERDIAAVAVRALTGDGHSGVKYVMTGPEALTQAEQVRVLGEAIGRPLRWEELPRGVAREELVVAFGDASYAEGALDAWAAFVTSPERVTSTVEEVTGQPARTFGQWAADHADDFR